MWPPSGDHINVVNCSDFVGLGHFLEHVLHSFIRMCVCTFIDMQVSVHVYWSQKSTSGIFPQELPQIDFGDGVSW